MNEPVAFARISDYGKGSPDPGTAVCAQHAVASPDNRETDAVGEIVAVDGTGLSCVVCKLDNADLIGTPVISYAYGTRVTVWGGRPDNDLMTSTKYDLRTGSAPILSCLPERVAPQGTHIPTKDARVSVVKRTREEIPHVPHVTKAGKWELSLPDQAPAYFDRKGDAVSAGLVRVAITDFWEGRAVALENQQVRALMPQREETVAADDVEIGDTIQTREHTFPFTVTAREVRQGFVWLKYVNQAGRTEWHRVAPTDTVTKL